jgi:pimeloyl-ACP methyl ester carboxylesterase
MADDAETVARTLGLSRYVLVSHSMGDKVAQIVAKRRPDGLVGLVLAGGPLSPKLREQVIEDTLRGAGLDRTTQHDRGCQRRAACVRQSCIADV